MTREYHGLAALSRPEPRLNWDHALGAHAERIDAMRDGEDSVEAFQPRDLTGA